MTTQAVEFKKKVLIQSRSKELWNPEDDRELEPRSATISQAFYGRNPCHHEGRRNPLGLHIELGFEFPGSARLFYRDSEEILDVMNELEVDRVEELANKDVTAYRLRCGYAGLSRKLEFPM